MSINAFFEKFDKVGKAVVLGAAVITVALTSLNFLISTQSQPLATAIQEVKAEQIQQESIIEKLATREDIKQASDKSNQRDNDIIHRLDIISNRLDNFIARVK